MNRTFTRSMLLLLLLTPSRMAAAAATVVALQPLDCTREPWVRPVAAAVRTTVELVNSTDQPRKIDYLDQAGQRHLVITAPPRKTALVQTFATVPLVVTDAADQCLAVYVPTDQPGRATLPAQAIQPSGVRSTVDMPDDTADYQIHVMYVVPSDGPDEKLDIDGALATSIAAGQQWFAGQTGGRRLRFDTYHGALDITFFRLSVADAQLRSAKSWEGAAIGAELAAAGFDQPNKVYAVYYGGSETVTCGVGVNPQNRAAHCGVIFLHGTEGGIPCNTYGLASSEMTPGYLDYSILHELLHALDFVPPCAPHYNPADPGHVDDDPHDLMYSGPRTIEWNPAVLDVGHDDYFEANIPGCLDLAKSVFLDPPAPDAAPPPDWDLPIRMLLPNQGCEQEAELRSQPSPPPTSIEFVNLTGGPLQLYWLDAQGERVSLGHLQPGPNVMNTYVSYPHVVTDPSGQCLGIFIATEQPGRVIVPATP